VGPRRQGPARFFVTVIAPNERALRALQAYDLDLFAPTSKLTEAGEATIEGLLSLREIGGLVQRGYRVLVEDEAGKRSRTDEVVGFDEWLKGREG
jgi:hypothetical protein